MSSSRQTEKTDTRRLVEAAAWRSHLTENDVESSENFEAWLAADAQNEIAWRQIQAPWGFFGEQATSPELLEARRSALGHARHSGGRRWRSQFSSSKSIGSVVAAGLLIIAAAAIFTWNLTRPDIYRTAAGERRTVTLPDGSKLALDVQSEVKVRYSVRARDLELVKGQARFDVAHDVERPFSVVVRGQKVIATGTAFNVDLLGSDVLVTLIEGRVVVVPDAGSSMLAPHPAQQRISGSPRDASPLDPTVSAESRAREGENASGARNSAGQGIELTAGEQLVISPVAPPNIVAANLERATAWQDGRLVFEDEPLLTAVTRLNRYSEREVRVADESTSRLRISGVFNAGDIDGFVATITSYLPVRAEPGEDGAIELTHP